MRNITLESKQKKINSQGSNGFTQEYQNILEGISKEEEEKTQKEEGTKLQGSLNLFASESIHLNHLFFMHPNQQFSVGDLSPLNIPTRQHNGINLKLFDLINSDYKSTNNNEAVPSTLNYLPTINNLGSTVFDRNSEESSKKELILTSGFLNQNQEMSEFNNHGDLEQLNYQMDSMVMDSKTELPPTVAEQNPSTFLASPLYQSSMNPSPQMVRALKEARQFDILLQQQHQQQIKQIPDQNNLELFNFTVNHQAQKDMKYQFQKPYSVQSCVPQYQPFPQIDYQIQNKQLQQSRMNMLNQFGENQSNNNSDHLHSEIQTHNNQLNKLQPEVNISQLEFPNLVQGGTIMNSANQINPPNYYHQSFDHQSPQMFENRKQQINYQIIKEMKNTELSRLEDQSKQGSNLSVVTNLNQELLNSNPLQQRIATELDVNFKDVNTAQVTQQTENIQILKTNNIQGALDCADPQGNDIIEEELETSSSLNNNSFPAKSSSQDVKINEYVRKVDFCKCKKTKCLKLYCECFLRGTFCNSQCICVECRNIEGNDEERAKAIEEAIQRNSEAFNLKFELSKNEITHKKGCKCKKTQCLKNYCECFNAGLKCKDNCSCSDCKNTIDGLKSQSSAFINDHIANCSTIEKASNTQSVQDVQISSTLLQKEVPLENKQQMQEEQQYSDQQQQQIVIQVSEVRENSNRKRFRSEVIEQESQKRGNSQDENPQSKFEPNPQKKKSQFSTVQEGTQVKPEKQRSSSRTTRTDYKSFDENFEFTTNLKKSITNPQQQKKETS